MPSSESSDVVIGIDLGTTYSCVAVFQNGTVEVIANDQGNRTTPSYVAFNDKERLIGEAAKNQAGTNPTNTVYDIKRIIGLKNDDPNVLEEIENWPFEVISGEDDKPRINVMYRGEPKSYSPEQISSMVSKRRTSGSRSRIKGIRRGAWKSASVRLSCRSADLRL
ncbi:putative heat shock 70 kDa protein 7 [Penaeus indicus]|uniref:putative heat shock 70 kDa protein 7 n=1 Tax=Penaeus indicus TaxID=29960 RepID=UPI00300D65BA